MSSVVPNDFAHEQKKLLTGQSERVIYFYIINNSEAGIWYPRPSNPYRQVIVPVVADLEQHLTAPGGILVCAYIQWRNTPS